jgi:hypothetical protein
VVTGRDGHRRPAAPPASDSLSRNPRRGQDPGEQQNPPQDGHVSEQHVVAREEEVDRPVEDPGKGSAAERQQRALFHQPDSVEEVAAVIQSGEAIEENGQLTKESKTKQEQGDERPGPG